MRRHKKGVIPYGWILVLVLVILAGLFTYRTMTGNPTAGTSSFVAIPLDATSNFISGATVTLQGAAGTLQSTPVTGKYVFMNIPPGSYTLSIQASGYAPSPYTAPVTLLTDAESSQTVFLSSSASTPAESTLLDVWSFNESALSGAEGEIAESIGKIKTDAGSIFRATSYGSLGVLTEGIHGASVAFDGVDDYASTDAQFGWQSGLPVTVTFWVRATSVGLHDGGLFGVGTDDTHRFAAYLWNDQKLYWDYGAPSGAGRLELNFAPYLDKWVQVALVSGGNGGTFKGIYVNGVLVASGTTSDGPDQALTTMNFGRAFAQGVAKYYPGALDEFKIYGRVLSAEEIAAAYSAQRSRLVSSDAQGLVAHWKFDETSVPTTAGAVKEANGFHGTAKGGVMNINEGIGGKSFKFDGIDDEVTISNAGILSPSSKITLSGWFKTGNLSAGDITTSWISKRESYLFGPWEDGHVSFFVFVGGQWVEVKTAAGLVKEGTWQHWVATYDGSGASIYLDGQKVAGPQAFSGALGTTGDVYLGHDAVAGVSRFFNGGIDNIQISDVALSATEVLALSTAQKAELSLAAKPATSVSDCGVLSQSGSYVLTKDLTATASCLTFTAGNIILEGSGYTIQQSSSASPDTYLFGLVANHVRNVTIRNLRVARFVQGTQFFNVSEFTLINVSFVNQSGHGLFLNASSKNFCTQCLFSSNSLAGVYLTQSRDNTFTDSTFTFNQIGISFLSNSVQNAIVRGFFANNKNFAWYNDSSSANNNIALRSSSGTLPNTPLLVERAQLLTGHSTTLAVGSTMSFKLNATDFHNLTVTSQTLSTATFILKSDPLSFTLSKGETRKADLNGDAIFDVSVKLVSLSTLSGANVLVTAIQEPMNTQDRQGQADDEDAGAAFERGSGSTALTNVTKAKSTEGGLSTPIIIGILVGIIVLVVALWAVWFYINDNRRAAEDEVFKPAPPASHEQPAPFS